MADVGTIELRALQVGLTVCVSLIYAAIMVVGYDNSDAVLALVSEVLRG